MTVLELAKRWAEPPRILIVEDDANLARTVTGLLSRYECDIESVTNLADALNAVRLRRFDMVFVDTGLKGGGLGVVKALKAKSPSTPILVLAGQERGLLEELWSCGMITVLRKPFDITAQQMKDALTMFKVKTSPRATVSATA